MEYLACPYSDKNSKVREKRFNIATSIAGILINNGRIIFSPITHSHPIANKCSLPKDWDYWKDFDTTILKVCFKVLVLTIDGWKDSVGVKNEIDLAVELRKPIFLIDSETLKELELKF